MKKIAEHVVIVINMFWSNDRRLLWTVTVLLYMALRVRSHNLKEKTFVLLGLYLNS